MLTTLLHSYVAIVAMELWWAVVATVETTIGVPRLGTPRHTFVYDLLLFLSLFAGWIVINLLWFQSTITGPIILVILAIGCLWDLEKQCSALLSVWWRRRKHRLVP